MNKLPVDYRGVQNIMSIDDSLTSHPVYVHVNHPNEINEIFDLVSYAKVLRFTFKKLLTNVKIAIFLFYFILFAYYICQFMKTF